MCLADGIKDFREGKLSCIIGMRSKVREWIRVRECYHRQPKKSNVFNQSRGKREVTKSSGKSYMGLHIKEFGYFYYRSLKSKETCLKATKET